LFNIDCNQIQKNNPNIRFRWYITKHIVLEDKNANLSDRYTYDYYEGEFEENSSINGKWVYSFTSDGGRYEGEFTNEKKEGRGT
jgi:hypothetical protein